MFNYPDSALTSGGVYFLLISFQVLLKLEAALFRKPSLLYILDAPLNQTHRVVRGKICPIHMDCSAENAPLNP
ncbi:MAG: hypothetical protein OXL41_13220 [Nitrospinae bacterium]|nr:hypothetical protein [Nitrospinota bacterium]